MRSRNDLSSLSLSGAYFKPFINCDDVHIQNLHQPLKCVALCAHACAKGPRCGTIKSMTFALIRYNAARKALAACHRIDEVKKIHDKATALLAYARQAQDFELQNQAAEIRLISERRAGQLLVGMEATGQRQAKERGRPKKESSSPTLPKLGITRDQSSKWQRMARLIDDATFEKALSRAREQFGELTTAGVLRAVKEVVKPAGTIVEPNINLLATELIRDIESASRKEKLKMVVGAREQLNPTITKKLILALKNASKDTANFEKQLTKGFQDFPNDGKAHQRVVRERMAEQPEPDLEEKTRLAANLKNAVVREITLSEARNLIVSQEWLGNLGSSEFAYGLFAGKYLAGAVCFGSTAGTHVKNSVCGSENAEKVITLTRGCCVFWSHPHSGSHLIAAACREMAKKGYNVIVAYSDPKANERGVLFRAVNFLFCGTTSPTEKYRTRDGKIYDSRNVHLLTRDRTGGTTKYKRTRAQQKQMMMDEGCEFYRDDVRKLRWVGIFGDRRQKRLLKAALRWPVLPYPKRSNAPSQPASIS
jgi:hypothetical protein